MAMTTNATAKLRYPFADRYLDVKPFGSCHHFLSEENPRRVAELVSETIREKGLARDEERT